MTKNAKKKRHIALAAEYSGWDFHGWQRQENAYTVQEELESAWKRLSGEEIVLYSSSRTDAGVSARSHVSSFFTESSIPTERIAMAWNTELNPAVAVLKTVDVAADFDARFDALGKEYCYSYYLNRTRPVIDRFRSYHVAQKIDIESMNRAALAFLGEHDFSALMDQGSPSKRLRRTLYKIDLVREGQFLHLKVIGDGFLYHMVRILAGTLYYVGIGKIEADRVPGLIEAGDRRAMGPTLPPQGLTLERVFYKRELFGDDRWPYRNWQAD